MRSSPARSSPPSVWRLPCSRTPARTDLLSGIASGERLATLAYTEESGRVDERGIQLQADGDRLTGAKHDVPDAHVAHTLIVAARSDEGVSLYAVAADAPGVSIEQVPTMDMTRRWCHRHPRRRARRAPRGGLGWGWPILERTLQKSAALLSSECVGGAEQGARHVRGLREGALHEQFGRPIGSFQAVKHRCADMLVDVEMARSAMYYAAWAASEDYTELPLAASIAKAWCGEAYTRVAANGIQVHGGIGFTWEHDMHLYFKRAKATEGLWCMRRNGNAAAFREGCGRAGGLTAGVECRSHRRSTSLDVLLGLAGNELFDQHGEPARCRERLHVSVCDPGLRQSGFQTVCEGELQFPKRLRRQLFRTDLNQEVPSLDLRGGGFQGSGCRFGTHDIGLHDATSPPAALREPPFC